MKLAVVVLLLCACKDTARTDPLTACRNTIRSKLASPEFDVGSPVEVNPTGPEAPGWVVHGHVDSRGEDGIKMRYQYVGDVRVDAPNFLGNGG